MDISHIRYFSKLYETLNYARASEELFVSRQALHKVIRQMERETGAPLFENVRNALVPTQAAHSLYRASRTAVRGFGEIDSAIAAMKLQAGEAKVLGRCIGADDVLRWDEKEKLNTHNDDMHDSLPFKLRTFNCSCDEVRESVLAGTFDYGIVIGGGVDPLLFDVEIGRTGRYYLTVRRDHPAAAWEHASLAEMRNLPFAVQGEGYDSHRLLVGKCREAGFDPSVVFSDPSMLACVNAVRAGLAVACTFLPAEDMGFGAELVSIPLTDPDLTWAYQVIAKKGLGDAYIMRYFCGTYTRWDTVTLPDIG